MVGIVIAAPAAARVTGTSAVPFDFTRILQYVAVNKDAFPSNPALPLAAPNHSACQNKPSSFT
jgi:hypothetical protein